MTIDDLIEFLSAFSEKLPDGKNTVVKVKVKGIFRERLGTVRKVGMDRDRDGNPFAWIEAE